MPIFIYGGYRGWLLILRIRGKLTIKVWQDGHQSSSEGNDWIDRAVPYGMDINGDNRTDLLIQYQEQNNHSWRVLINNGINGIPKMEHIDIIEASCTKRMG